MGARAFFFEERIFKKRERNTKHKKHKDDKDVTKKRA